MKKWFLLLGLLTTATCLTACGSKDFNMSFDEALEIANHSEFQDILAWTDTFEQDLNISGNYNSEWTKIDAQFSSNNKQNIQNNDSEASANFSANIVSEGENVKIDWALDIKQIGDIIYLNLSSFDLTWSEDLSMVAMMTEWFKNQWFSIPMTWLSDIPNTFSVLKDSKELNDKTKDIIINDGSVVYSWKFTQFNGYNARKFSLDNEKLNALIKEYYDSMYNNLDEEISEEAPELNIQNFEWYLVITWKDKVTTVIENMDIAEEDIILSANWFAGEDYEFNISEWEESLITISANKKGWKYKISAQIADSVYLNWTISPKLSKSSIEISFDATITIKAQNEWENDNIIPFKGSRKYKSISEFTTTAPENAQDLSDLISSYLGWMMGWTDYDYNYDEDYNYEDYDYSEELGNGNIEWLENILEPEEAQPEEIAVEETITE